MSAFHPGAAAAARRRASRLTAAALLVSPALPRPIAAQDAEPLTKTELVRFLSGGVYAPDELAGLVRRSCLSFEPTDRDRADLRSLGASGTVMEAIEWCSRPLEVSIEPSELTLRAGQPGSVTLRATRDGRPVAGVGLALGPSGGNSPSGVTDERGVVRLPVAATGRARSYRLPVWARGANVAGAPDISVRVLPGPPASASIVPASVLLDEAADVPAHVRAELRDEYGNPVAGVPVNLADPETGFGVSTGRTGPGGDVELRLIPGTMAENGVLELRAGERVLGEVEVEVRARPGPEADEPEEETAPRRAEDEPAERAPAAVDERTEGEPAADPDPDSLEDARSLADRGETERAVASYRALIEAAPRNVALRLELARLLDRSDRVEEAKATYEEVLAVAPGNVDASRGLARLDREGARVDASVSGGATLEGSPALRGAEVSLRPLRFLRVWGRYDRSLGVDGVPFIRGPDEIEGYFGGVAVSWGADRLLTTSVEVGRRIDDVARSGGPAGSLDQNTIRVEQRIHVPAARGYATFAAGGFVGRWFDRDDWLAYGRVRVPIVDGLDIGPAVYTGETVGTDAVERGRAPERETRVEFPIRLGTADGWFVEPAGSIGWVAGTDDSPTRRLYEARLLAEAALADGVAIRVFGRHQAAPGTEPFTLAAVGLRIRFR